MTTLRLDEVCDDDCVVSFNPLRFDMPVPHREAVGAAAILRRVLYRWCTLLGSIRADRSIGVTTPLPDLEGARPDDLQILILQGELEAQARAEDYVLGALADLTWDGVSKFTAKGRIQLVDGRTYALELASAASAGVALLAIGATQ